MEKIRDFRPGFWPCAACALVLLYVAQSVLIYVAVCGVFVLSVFLFLSLCFSLVRLYSDFTEARGRNYKTWCECQKLLSESTVTLIPDRHKAIIRTGDRQEYAIIPPVCGSVQKLVQAPAQDDTQPPRPLLPLLSGLDRVLLIGGMGSGKSTLLKHLVQARTTQGETLIIDSHAGPDTWPGGVKVIGRGRNYEEITGCIKSLHSEMDRRYKQLSSGAVAEGAFRRVNLVIDEFTVLNRYCKVKDEISSLLCECRKVGITLCVAGQSDRVKSLGLQGEGDLVQGFEAVCYLEKASDGERYGMVRMGREKELVRYSHPGVFGGVSLPSPRAEKEKPDAGRAATVKILALHTEGKSVSTISKAVYGRSSKANNDKIREILKGGKA